MYNMQLVEFATVAHTYKTNHRFTLSEGPEPYLSRLGGGGIFVLVPPSNHKATQARTFITATP